MINNSDTEGEIMKKTLSLILAVILIIGMMPLQALAEATTSTETKVESIEPVVEDKGALEIGEEVQPEPVGEGEPNVTLVGQWINESTTKEDTLKHYELTDKIGYEKYNSGLLRGKAKQFLGWSDKAPVANGVLADGAKLFSPEDLIADVFGSSIPVNAKIYAVYFEINKPYGDPLPGNPFDNLVPGQLATEIKDRINDNKALIDEKVKAEDILKGTDNYSADGVIIDKYKKTDDDKTINEVVLNSEFEMDWAAAMLAYRNIAGSNQLRPILSRDYNTRYQNNNFPTNDGKATGYTHVDLNMDFGKDEGLVVPDKLFLEFKSYSWRPLYAFGIKEDGTKEVLSILDANGNTKGQEIDAFKTLVNGKKPETRFGVETKGFRKITIRVVLREWDNSVTKPHQNPFSGERIPESSIPKGPKGTVASEILSNMTLRVLGSADGIANENIVRITDARAEELAYSEGKESITITGSIKGYMLSSLGTFQVGRLNVPLESDAEINESKANELKLSYVHEKEEPKPEPKPEPQPEYNPFWPIYFGSTKKAEDVKEKEIHKAYIFGYTDKTVKGNGNLTRAEAAAMVTRLAGLDLSDKSKAQYNDLQDGAWYLPNINAALKAGMIDATDNSLRPDDKITRGEFAKMLAAIDKDNDYVSSFSDIKGHKYEKEINKIDGNKRIEGYQDGTFKPDGFLTRAEAASFLNRMFNRVADDMAIEDYVNSIFPFKDLDKNDWFYFEIVEATNTHELYRRGGSDKFERAFEKWTNVLN